MAWNDFLLVRAWAKKNNWKTQSDGKSLDMWAELESWLKFSACWDGKTMIRCCKSNEAALTESSQLAKSLTSSSNSTSPRRNVEKSDKFMAKVLLHFKRFFHSSQVLSSNWNTEKAFGKSWNLFACFLPETRRGRSEREREKCEM